MRTETHIDNGKYTIVHDNGADLQILRNGEQWMGASFQLLPVKMLVAVAAEIDKLRADKAKLHEALGKELASTISLWQNVQDLKTELEVYKSLSITTTTKDTRWK
jgi:hypothetical protein